MHKNALILLKNCKNLPALVAPLPDPTNPTPLRKPDYATDKHNLRRYLGLLIYNYTCYAYNTNNSPGKRSKKSPGI